MVWDQLVCSHLILHLFLLLKTGVDVVVIHKLRVVVLIHHVRSVVWVSGHHARLVVHALLVGHVQTVFVNYWLICDVRVAVAATSLLTNVKLVVHLPLVVVGHLLVIALIEIH